MNRLLKYELYKAASRRIFWGLLLAAVALNVLILWWSQRDPDMPGFSETKAFYGSLREIPKAQKSAWLAEEQEFLSAVLLKEQIELEQSAGGDADYLERLRAQYREAYSKYEKRLDGAHDYPEIRARKAMTDQAASELRRVEGYEEYLDEIERTADTLLDVSIFGESLEGFSARNIEKTAAHYAGMRGRDIAYDGNRGVGLLLRWPVSDVILLLIVLALSYALMTDEKERRLFGVIKAAPGGGVRTITAKLTALLIFVAGANLLIFASTGLFAEYAYGLGDLMRTVQSVPALMGSILKLNVLEYLLVQLLLKTAGFYVLTLAIFLTAVCVKHAVFVLLAAAGLWGIGTGLSYIPAQSAWNWLKYLNPLTLSNPNEILKSYFNLNFFGQPVRLIPVFSLFVLALFAVFLFLNIRTHLRKKGMEAGRPLPAFLAGRLPVFRRGAGTSYIGYELKKQLILNKAALILLLFAAFQAWTVREQSAGLDYFDYQYKREMTVLEGALTRKKRLTSSRKRKKWTKPSGVRRSCGRSMRPGRSISRR